MNGYFRPLRRKLGVLTLGLACLIGGVWIRSLVVSDFLTVSNREWISVPGAMIHRTAGAGYPAGFHYENVAIQPWGGISDYDDEWDSLKYGFGYRTFPVTYVTGAQRRTSTTVDIRVPYWSVVIPLTLLSVWLLLSKPRQKPTAPQPADQP